MEAEARVRKSPSLQKVHGLQTRDETSFRPEMLKRYAIIFFIATGAFVLGYGAMWLSSKQNETKLTSVVKTLRPSVLQNDLATASINAYQGKFEQARLQASTFFTDLRAEVERDNSAFGPGEQEALQSIISQRDETITMLAREEPGSAGRLSEMYFRFMQMKNSAVAGDNQNTETF